MPILENDLLQAVKCCRDKKVFIFDMDGLIFDTERLFMEQLAIVMREYGYELTREIYMETLGMGGVLLEEKMQSHYGSDYPFYEISKKADNRVQAVAETVGLYMKPQIREVLQYLKEEGVPCAVASSTRSAMVELYLKKAGIYNYFREIIGGEMAEKSKPKPDIFLLACEKMEMRPEECMVLEDSENGIRAANAAGCEVICVPDLKMPCEEVANLARIICAKAK